MKAYQGTLGSNGADSRELLGGELSWWAEFVAEGSNALFRMNESNCDKLTLER